LVRFHEAKYDATLRMSTPYSTHLADVFSIEVSFGLYDCTGTPTGVVRDIFKLVGKLLYLVCKRLGAETVELLPNRRLKL
jgi:hypothetical protein